MANKKKDKDEADTVRVNLTFTREEYEELEKAAEKDKRTPTTMAKVLVLKAIEEAS